MTRYVLSTRKLVKTKTSLVFTIPFLMSEKLGWKAGDFIDISQEENAIKLTKHPEGEPKGVLGGGKPRTPLIQESPVPQNES